MYECKMHVVCVLRKLREEFNLIKRVLIVVKGGQQYPSNCFFLFFTFEKLVLVLSLLGDGRTSSSSAVALISAEAT
jgi:hypothetical protein